jgi:hypothetical protein
MKWSTGESFIRIECDDVLLSRRGSLLQDTFSFFDSKTNCFPMPGRKTKRLGLQPAIVETKTSFSKAVRERLVPGDGERPRRKRYGQHAIVSGACRGYSQARDRHRFGFGQRSATRNGSRVDTRVNRHPTA